jgi:hypothetical protein
MSLFGTKHGVIFDDDFVGNLVQWLYRFHMQFAIPDEFHAEVGAGGFGTVFAGLDNSSNDHRRPFFQGSHTLMSFCCVSSSV